MCLAFGGVIRVSLEAYPYKCFDPSGPVHKPLSEVKHSDAVKLLEDKDFMKSCGSPDVQKAIKNAVKNQASKFAK